MLNPEAPFNMLIFTLMKILRNEKELVVFEVEHISVLNDDFLDRSAPNSPRRQTPLFQLRQERAENLKGLTPHLRSVAARVLKGGPDRA